MVVFVAAGALEFAPVVVGGGGFDGRAKLIKMAIIKTLKIYNKPMFPKFFDFVITFQTWNTDFDCIFTQRYKNKCPKLKSRHCYCQKSAV